MGAAIEVFLRNEKLPTVDVWNAAIAAEGFDVILDAFDPRSNDGYWPASLNGNESGFEWYLSEVAQMEEVPAYPFKGFVGDCELRGQLCFSSHADEEAAAAIAGAVLAKLSGGYYRDAERDGRLLEGADAIAAAWKIVSAKGLG
jgi:hypothetical protein